MTSLPDSPTQKSPPRRLQRYDRTPPRRPARDLPESPVLAEPSGRIVNAFDVLANGAQKLKQRRQDELKNRPDLAAFLEDEAAESDDEDAFGFAKPKTTDDDENEEDLDATLHELMDDKEMDQDTIASELVHAKFMFVLFISSARRVLLVLADSEILGSNWKWTIKKSRNSIRESSRANRE